MLFQRRYQTSVSVYVIPIVYGMIGVARTGSVYLTMSVTLERYFAIVRPLSSFRMKRWLAPISISFATIYNVPRFFELERYNFPYTNETLVRATTLRKNDLYVSIYNTWMKMVSVQLFQEFSLHFWANKRLLWAGDTECFSQAPLFFHHMRYTIF